ncbi:kinase-like protein [Obba rivulosa]|uniref:Kinase-like protein n=1 Tax=Obba rivulosa TaxID=1052685 RepID=A0A8E2B2B2_9APHY|nr:kinase-like protein [Obba rivulosa]
MKQMLPVAFLLAPGTVKTTYTPYDEPDGSGGFADVWKGIYNGRVVALKVIRGIASKSSRSSEAVIWKYLRHRNITPFYGIDVHSFRLSFVSNWMIHGTVTSFLKNNPSANCLSILPISLQDSKYLHDMGIVHGDIKCSNILIDEHFVAKIADFGLSALSYSHKLTTRSTVAGSLRYTAPEIIDPEAFGFLKASASQ